MLEGEYAYRIHTKSETWIDQICRIAKGTTIFLLMNTLKNPSTPSSLAIFTLSPSGSLHIQLAQSTTHCIMCAISGVHLLQLNLLMPHLFSPPPRILNLYPRNVNTHNKERTDLYNLHDSAYDTCSIPSRWTIQFGFNVEYRHGLGFQTWKHIDRYAVWRTRNENTGRKYLQRHFPMRINIREYKNILWTPEIYSLPLIPNPPGQLSHPFMNPRCYVCLFVCFVRMSWSSTV